MDGREPRTVNMGDLSTHFDRNEFRCKDGCGRDTIDYDTLKVVEDIRNYFKKPVTINSAFRCAEHNAEIGGSAGSQHLVGRACDIVVEGISPDQVANYAENGPLEGRGGVGRYSTFTHVDTRTDGPARWYG